MKFVTITGPMNDIDRFANTYLTKYDIHLENALSQLSSSDNLIPFKLDNPYEKTLLLLKNFPVAIPSSKEDVSLLPITDAVKCVDDINKQIIESNASIDELKSDLTRLEDKYHAILPYKSLDFNISEILSYEYVRFRFGRIPIEYLNRLEYYVYKSLDAIFIEGDRENNYVYGVYFAATADVQMIDSIFASLHFERMFMQDEYKGTPKATCESLEEQIKNKKDEIEKIIQKEKSIINDNIDLLSKAKTVIENYMISYNIRNKAALTTSDNKPFYILCGWMKEDDSKKFLKEAKKDDNLFVIIDLPKDKEDSTPPTLLRTLPIFKPFIMFVKMYGLPSYNELDPTVFLAITYTFIFGIMFGDVGQGLLLLIIGFLLYKFKKINLAGIISFAGFFSTIFGFLFGSIFGFENIIKPLWIRPLSNMSSLPFIGKLNTVFIVTVAFGMILILITMILNIINCFKLKKPITSLFDKNGIAGFIFYLSVVTTIILLLSRKPLPAKIICILMFGLPILIMIFAVPISNILKRKPALNDGIGMFIVDNFFELFEMLLSYFSNTLSFVRIGAFAVSHAAMMEVVLMLSGIESANPNYLIIILGNLFVCAMEGLVVGIQVLRLEYYELFSRFYVGGGKEFISYKNTLKKGETK